MSRDPIHVLTSLSDQSKKNPEYVFNSLYRNLYNPEFYLRAYKNICANDGSMTPGVDGDTLDGMSQHRINELIQSLRDRTYRPKPARREYIPKKNDPTKERPLGIPSANDKLVQEVVRMILESIFTPNFSSHSHGFIIGRSVHTCLTEVQHTFTGAVWFIEGDISKCFDSFDHHILIDLLRRRIRDEAFIQLMWKFLKAGYMEQWVFNNTYTGTPQGSGISPILANIYLSELDSYVEEYAAKFERGDPGHRKINPEYRRLSHQISKVTAENQETWDTLSDAERKTRAKQVKDMKAELRRISRHITGETGFKRLKYCRYADDFLIGVIGSKEDAEKIKAELAAFLSEKLKLELSLFKTKITHTTERATFLGYDITVSRSQDARKDSKGRMVRAFRGKVQLLIPEDKIKKKLLELGAIRITKDKSGQEHWKAIHRGKLMNLPDIDILGTYNSEIRGLANFYALAISSSSLWSFAGLMMWSMLKTFAGKYKSSCKKMKAKYIKNDNFTVSYNTKAGQKESVFYNEGFKRQKFPIKDEPIDVIVAYKKYASKNTLAERLKAGKCELCGDKCEHIEMHQVKKLKNLKGDTHWEKLMIKRRRRTLAVCAKCHLEIHESKMA